MASPGSASRLPLFRSLGGYQRGWLRGDLIAGLTVWAVLIPESLAYASIAGVSPVVGLYAAPGALLLYAALGSSRHLVTGPMSATAALSAATVGDLATQGSGHFVTLTAGLAIAVGLAALIAGVLRLGFLASFISEPVIKGFIVGLALTIIVGQLPKLAGIDAGSGDFFEKLWDFVSGLGAIDATTLAVALLSLALVLGLRRFAPSVPGSLVAVLLSIAAVAVLGLDDHGVAIVGNIDPGLPALGLPDLGAGDFGDLAAGAIGVMLVGFAEGLGAAKTYAARHHYDTDPNRELIGLGGANLASGLSSGMVVNGSLSKTAVNGSAGANTQLSGLVVALLTVFTLLVLTGLFEQLPEATLAAVVIAAVIELVDIPSLVRLYRVYARSSIPGRWVTARPDFVAAAAAMLGVLVFDTLPGLSIGISVSLLLLLYRSARPNVAVLGRVPGTAGQYADLTRHPDNRTVAGVEVLRVESGLFFANADWVRQRIRRAAAHPDTHTVILDAETVPFVDVTAAQALAQAADDLSEQDVKLVLARDVGQVRDVLHQVGTSQIEVYPDVDTAVRESTGER
ncbi:MAG TPA: SulP family inorganic anion transporter [Thermoleophilaceae bacterium]|nr:SulP family inorganic anion transporter [Thermoleophilaceae bacterium]